MSSPLTRLALGLRGLSFLTTLYLHWGAKCPGFAQTNQALFFLKEGLEAEACGLLYLYLFLLLWSILLAYLLWNGLSCTVFALVDIASVLAATLSFLFVSSMIIWVIRSSSDICLCLCFNCCLVCPGFHQLHNQEFRNEIVGQRYVFSL